MELDSVLFDYDVGERRFFTLTYYFAVGYTGNSAEECSKVAQNEFKILEEMVDEKYPADQFEKKESGEASNIEIKSGLRYSPTDPKRVIKNTYLNLNHFIGLGPEGPTNWRIRLSVNYDNPDRMLELYDSVMKIPNLTFSESAESEMKKIDFLRKQPFNLEEYIAIGQ